MGTCMFGFPNLIDQATLSGGSYQSTLPRSNIQTRKIKEVAQTVDTAKTSSIVNMDLGQIRNVRLVSANNHNFSLNSKYRLRNTTESSATNLALYSEQLNNAAWSAVRSSVASNAATAPDGNVTADKIVENTSVSSTHYLSGSGTISVTSGQSYTISVFAKDAGRDLHLGFSDNTPFGVLSPAGVFDLSSGTVDSSIDGATCRISDAGSGWYRCKVTAVATSTSTTNVKISLYNGGTSYTGDGSSALYAWGAQFESGSRATSYYPTTGSSAVRAAGYMDLWQSYNYDSSWQDVWPVVYPYGSLQWEDPNWWGGKYTVEELEGQISSLIIMLPTNQLARYWRLEIDDTTNADGVLQLGRIFIGPAWQPAIQLSWGESLGIETDTQVQKALGGSEYFQRRPGARVDTYRLDNLTRDEGMSRIYEMQRRAGIDQEILWIQDTSDTAHAIRTRYLARLKVLNAIEYPVYNTNSIAIEMKELI